MKSLILVCLCIAILHGVSAEIFEVKNSKDWQIVLDSRAAWIVGFSDSEHSEASGEQAREVLNDVSGSLSDYGVRISSVDCGLNPNKKLCKTLPRKTVPSFGFVTEAPQINPYSGKNYRPVAMLDSSEFRDVKAFERKFAKQYPNNIKKVNVEDLPAGPAAVGTGTGTIVYFSPKDTVNLFAKSLCYAFPDVSCLQVSNWDPAEVVAKLNIEAQTLPDRGTAVVGYISAGGAFTAYQSEAKGGSSDVTKERAEVISFLSQASGKAPEAAAAAAASAGENADEASPSARGGRADVKQQNANEFDGEVDANVAWLVRVYAATDSDKSPTAAAATDAWNKAVSSVCEGSILPMQILCPSTPPVDSSASLTFGQKLCNRRALPYMAVLPYIGEGGDSSVRKSPGGLPVFDISDRESAKKAILSSFPEDLVARVHESEVDAVLAAAAKKKTTCVILLSDREQPPVILRNIAVTLRKYATVAFISEPSAQFLARVGSTHALPTVILAAPPPKSQSETVPAGGITIMQYDPVLFGPLKFNGLQNFILSAYQRSGLMEEAAAEAAASSAADPTADITGTLQQALLPVSTEDQWQAECSGSYRGLCVVGLLAGNAADGTVGILESAMRRMGKQGAAFRFLTVDGLCQASFSGRFDAQVDTLPRLVAYSPAKKRYMLLSASLSEDNVVAFLSSALNGKASSHMIPQRPELVPTCEVQEAPAAGVEDAVGEEDMDDLLEEIRKEEESKKAARKQALAQEKKEAEAAAAKAEAEAAKPAKIKRVVKKAKKGKKSAKDASADDEL